MNSFILLYNSQNIQVVSYLYKNNIQLNVQEGIYIQEEKLQNNKNNKKKKTLDMKRSSSVRSFFVHKILFSRIFVSSYIFQQCKNKIQLMQKETSQNKVSFVFIPIHFILPLKIMSLISVCGCLYCLASISFSLYTTEKITTKIFCNEMPVQDDVCLVFFTLFFVSCFSWTTSSFKA